jgi:mannan endo-1,4-beta-mannosidase
LNSGQSYDQKGTSLTYYQSLETDEPGQWNNDEVLKRLDDVMYNAHQYGIKLLISLHSYNILENKGDFYGKWYGTGNFYTDSNAINYFKQRIAHILSHVNPHNGKPWSQCSEYIFAFEAQNEAMNGDESFLRQHGPAWQCDMATTIRNNLNGNKNILVTTGGGGWLDVSLLDGYFSCGSLDVLAIHAYGTSDYDTGKLSGYVSKAKGFNKKLLFQEWGACYYNNANERCGPPGSVGVLDTDTRASNINKWSNQINQAGIPWMYWQVIPNNDPHQDWDYEVGTPEGIWKTLASAMNNTRNVDSAFDYSPWLI